MAAKINMRLDKNPMPSQDPNVRNKNFLEVALGYTEEQALDEAARCLHCKNHPCVDGCPVNVRIPEFIAKIVERDYEVRIRSSIRPAPCPPCAAASAPRRANAKCTASGARRATPWASAAWSALWPTGTTPTAPRPPKSPSPTATRWRWWLRPCGPDLRRRPGQEGL